MKIIAFTLRANKEDLDLVKRCLSLLETDYNIYNIPQYNPENFISKDCLVIVFGENTKLIIDQIISINSLSEIRVIELPSINKLYNIQENFSFRYDTFNKIKELKHFINQNNLKINIKKEDLIDFNKLHFITLKEVINKKGFYLEISKNGKLLCIGEKNKSIKADIFLSFEELYTLRLAMDVLKINEIQLVKLIDKENLNE